MSIKGFGEPLKDTAAPVIVKSGAEQRVHRDVQTQTPNTVSNKIVTGDVDPDALQEGTHTLTGDQILGDGDRVEDNPSKETATQSVTDRIITGQTEATPTRDEGLTSVTAHEVSGEIANTATDNGALQAPSLPVEVSSGKLGPGASYNSQSPNTTVHNTAKPLVTTVSDSHLGTGQNGQLVAVCAAVYNMYTDAGACDIGERLGVTGDITEVITVNWAYEIDGNYSRNRVVGVAMLTGTGSWSLTVEVQDGNYDWHNIVTYAASRFSYSDY